MGFANGCLVIRLPGGLERRVGEGLGRGWGGVGKGCGGGWGGLGEGLGKGWEGLGFRCLKNV